MSMLALILLIAALVLFIIGAIGVPSGRINVVAAGLACWVASLLISRGGGVG
jgi:Na+/H+-dicarboxylate symporter